MLKLGECPAARQMTRGWLWYRWATPSASETALKVYAPRLVWHVPSRARCPRPKPGPSSNSTIDPTVLEQGMGPFCSASSMSLTRATARAAVAANPALGALVLAYLLGTLAARPLTRCVLAGACADLRVRRACVSKWATLSDAAAQLFDTNARMCAEDGGVGPARAATVHVQRRERRRRWHRRRGRRRLPRRKRW